MFHYFVNSWLFFNKTNCEKVHCMQKFATVDYFFGLSSNTILLNVEINTALLEVIVKNRYITQQRHYCPLRYQQGLFKHVY